jgi:hypothetical protein
VSGQDEWGPWIEHDGRGCPVPNGTIVQVFEQCAALGLIGPNVGVSMSGNSWIWQNFPEFTKVICYRVRKPRGMAILEQAIQSQEVDA